MGIGMKKGVVENLLAVIVRQLFPDLRHVVAHCLQSLDLVNRDAFDVFHDQDFPGGKLLFQLGRGDICDFMVQVFKFQQVSSFL